MPREGDGLRGNQTINEPETIGGANYKAWNFINGGYRRARLCRRLCKEKERGELNSKGQTEDCRPFQQLQPPTRERIGARPMANERETKVANYKCGWGQVLGGGGGIVQDWTRVSGDVH